jgi:hypothetical protein
MWENQQLVISNIEEDVLARAIKQQWTLLKEVLEAIESRDMALDEIKETLSLVEKNLRRVRLRFLNNQLRHSTVK